MGEVEFRGGAGAWTQRVQSGRRYHFLGQAIPLIYCAWEKITSSCTAYGGREGHTRCHGYDHVLTSCLCNKGTVQKRWSQVMCQAIL